MVWGNTIWPILHSASPAITPILFVLVTRGPHPRLLGWDGTTAAWYDADPDGAYQTRTDLQVDAGAFTYGDGTLQPRAVFAVPGSPSTYQAVTFDPLTYALVPIWDVTEPGPFNASGWHAWGGPIWQWVDPAGETQAVVREMDSVQANPNVIVALEAGHGVSSPDDGYAPWAHGATWALQTLSYPSGFTGGGGSVHGGLSLYNYIDAAYYDSEPTRWLADVQPSVVIYHAAGSVGGGDPGRWGWTSGQHIYALDGSDVHAAPVDVLLAGIGSDSAAIATSFNWVVAVAVLAPWSLAGTTDAAYPAYGPNAEGAIAASSGTLDGRFHPRGALANLALPEQPAPNNASYFWAGKVWDEDSGVAPVYSAYQVWERVYPDEFGDYTIAEVQPAFDLAACADLDGLGQRTASHLIYDATAQRLIALVWTGWTDDEPDVDPDATATLHLYEWAGYADPTDPIFPPNWTYRGNSGAQLQSTWQNPRLALAQFDAAGLLWLITQGPVRQPNASGSATDTPVRVTTWDPAGAGTWDVLRLMGTISGESTLVPFSGWLAPPV